MSEENLEQVNKIKSALSLYLERHKESSVSPINLGGTIQAAVENPWSDDSIKIFISSEVEPVVHILNKVRLPERFSAIYHINEKKMEFIYTAYPLPKKHTHVKNREFTFNFQGKSYPCKFSTSSDELLIIAEYSRPVSDSTTSHRNLQSFNTYARNKSNTSLNSSTPLGEPLSFWVGNVDWNNENDEENIVTLAENLTFFMSYLDRASPFIVVHPPKVPEEIARAIRERSVKEQFPTVISGRPMDDILLQFWRGCITGSQFSRFINAYRVLEYSAFFMVEEKIRSSIRKSLLSPDALSDVDKIIDKISAGFGSDKLQDSQKIEVLFRECVSLSRLWSEVLHHNNSFTSETRFDGGFCAQSLIKSGWTQSDFEQNGHVVVPQLLKKVRNALSHGKDQATATCITPTHHNMLRLKPWADLARTAAEEVMIYKRYTI